MWAGAGFGMVLHAEERQCFVPESFDGLIVEIHMRYDGAVFFETFAIHRESVVLAGDFDPAGVEILNGLISTAMAEF